MSYIDPHKYDSIKNLPYKKSKQHKWMSQLDRASQFAPFAALSGHKETMDETGRLVDYKITLDEDALNLLNQKIHYILSSSNFEVIITYFVKDAYKEGGKYMTLQGDLTSVDQLNKSITVNHQKINIDDIIDIDSPIFNRDFLDK